MPVLILGSIYTGICTPTEAAVISVVYALVVGMFVYREIKLSNLKEILLSSVMTTASVMLIVSASNLFGWIMTREQLPQAAANLFLSISDSKYVFLLLVNLLLLLVGLFCDAGAAIVILAPILAPVASALGIDLIHFGIIMMVNLAVGMMTPPVGVNLYVVCDTANVKIESMMKYLLIYFAVLVADILLITYIPAISLTLPALMN
jgi:C4-dicarboxylate transporter DctM subunit